MSPADKRIENGVWFTPRYRAITEKTTTKQTGLETKFRAAIITDGSVLRNLFLAMRTDMFFIDEAVAAFRTFIHKAQKNGVAFGTYVFLWALFASALYQPDYDPY